MDCLKIVDNVIIKQSGTDIAATVTEELRYCIFYNLLNLLFNRN